MEKKRSAAQRMCERHFLLTMEIFSLYSSCSSPICWHTLVTSIVSSPSYDMMHQVRKEDNSLNLAQAHLNLALVTLHTSCTMHVTQIAKPGYTFQLFIVFNLSFSQQNWPNPPNSKYFLQWESTLLFNFPEMPSSWTQMRHSSNSAQVIELWQTPFLQILQSWLILGLVLYVIIYIYLVI